MKKTLSLLSLAVLVIGLLGSCSKINERLDGLDKRINNLESDKIASVEQQIAAINQSIADLGTIRTNIQTLMDAKTAMGEDITALKAKDQELEGKINDLKAYVDTELAKYATKDWANATFATLAKQAEIIADVTKLKQDLAGLDAALDQAIEDLDSSLKAWVNEQLSAYSTTAQMEAKVKALQDQIDALKADNETNKSDIEELEAGLAELEEDLAAAKESIKTAYEKAIKDALESNNGYITEKIKRAISSANGSISSLSSRVGTLETQVETLRGDVDDLKGMIQSVTIIPAYSDGSVKAEGGILTINCVITPKTAVEGLARKNFTVLTSKSEVLTKSALYGTIAIAKDDDLVLDKVNGTATIKVDVSSALPTEEGKALTVAVNISSGISDFTTNFVPVYIYVSQKTFKAVYKGDDGTLTFYYDNSLHVGEGDLYDNLTTSATQSSSWGYNSVRSNIKKVVITESVKNYKGLTSTAYMFQGMTKATGISGAEYLDVLNVTDMSWMFQNFGGGASGNPTTLNSVPDVSGWNTGKVTNMAGMFWGYGNFSSELDKVPDVSGWNTGEVTNMSNMFQKYGYSSTEFNAVPDVSEWNTAKVESMTNMFNAYATNSTALDTIPDVSKWTTSKVNDMSQVFYYYGNKSTALDTVPDVSGWQTGEVKKLSNMFEGYGNGAVEVNLDLSGWDLSGLTTSDENHVFNFNSTNFIVKIPAKTGETDNNEDHWYNSDGTNYIGPPTNESFTTPTPG